MKYDVTIAFVGNHHIKLVMEDNEYKALIKNYETKEYFTHETDTDIIHFNMFNIACIYKKDYQDKKETENEVEQSPKAD